jgi:Rrf2 family protein
MNFSKTTEYALRILSYMSLDETKLYSANELFEKLQIPFRYLRKQMNFLLKQGFLVSIQGKQGGYQIARPLNEISLMDIVEATDDNKMENMCFFGFHECPLTKHCAMHDKWGDVRDQTLNILKTTTLLDLKQENNTVNLSLKLNTNN